MPAVNGCMGVPSERRALAAERAGNYPGNAGRGGWCDSRGVHLLANAVGACLGGGAAAYRAEGLGGGQVPAMIAARTLSAMFHARI